MNTLRSQLEDHAAVAGADLIGIASIDRFDEIAPEHHPSSIMPEAKSVIVVGKRIARGTLRGVEEGTQLEIYPMYGRDWLNTRILSTITYKTAEFLEDNGWEAVPIQDLPAQIPPMGIPVRQGQPAPNVMIDVADAAVRAGLGEIGYCGLFLSPQYGPRQRFQLILTSAELTPDLISDETICDKCRDHASFCPLGAIDTASEHILTICGKMMRIASIDDAKCKSCKNGALPNPHHPSGRADRIAALCTRSCINHLESQGCITNTFYNPFRKRAPWGVIEEKRMLNTEER